MNNKLNFTRTQSLNKFKLENNITKINIIKNPNTGLVFFVSPEDSSIRGAISKSIDYSKETFISECIEPETGEEVLMMHNSNSNADNVLQTL